MKKLAIAVQIVILLFNYNFDVSAKKMVCKKCENLYYERLFMKSIGHNFFVPPSMVPNEFCDPPINAGIKTCSRFLPTNIISSERSTCPWYTTIIHDPTVFPSRRTEAVCRCDVCMDSTHNTECVTVFAKMTFLKRSDECIDGLYLYTPLVINVAVACACASKIDQFDNSSMYDYSYDTDY
ncbi:uncharacterized protein LOC115223097 [Octopus sinensis]|uniref:Uncharacterized protein LOC115223097 n=1 Tax=Octopus sinensis TaxID=2607531 RepID=A0A6P7TE30_9MOLL|nr:uncharacterized protein LOC115223097 [Octopus sinensis]